MTGDPVSEIMIHYPVLPEKCDLWDDNKAFSSSSSKIASMQCIVT